MLLFWRTTSIAFFFLPSDYENIDIDLKDQLVNIWSLMVAVTFLKNLLSEKFMSQLTVV